MIDAEIYVHCALLHDDHRRMRRANPRRAGNGKARHSIPDVFIHKRPASSVDAGETLFLGRTRSCGCIPEREGRFHLNALKFLESYCTDCLKIMGIKNNGDGTIDLTVQITHPFKGHPEYTGLDVKGIIMFNGSHALDTSYYGSNFIDTPSQPISFFPSKRWEIRRSLTQKVIQGAGR